MRIKEIHFAPKFTRQFRKLPHEIKLLVEEKVDIFKDNPFDSRLKTHKLHGGEKGVLAFSLNQSYRIKFIFVSENEVLFTAIGTHAIYE